MLGTIEVQGDIFHKANVLLFEVTDLYNLDRLSISESRSILFMQVELMCIISLHGQSLIEKLSKAVTSCKFPGKIIVTLSSFDGSLDSVLLCCFLFDRFNLQLLFLQLKDDCNGQFVSH